MRYLPILLLLLLLVSCAPTRKSCERNYGPCGFIEAQTTVTYKDTTIYLPGARVTDTLTMSKWDTLTLHTVTVKTDSTGRAQLRWYRDAYGRVVAECRAKSDTVIFTKYHTTIKEVKVKQAAGSAPAGWIVATVVLGLLVVGYVVFKVWGLLKK